MRFLKDSGEELVLYFPDSCFRGYEVYSGRDVVMEYPSSCDGDPRTWDMTTAGRYSTSIDVPTSKYDMDNVVGNGIWKHAMDMLPAGTYRLSVGLLGYEGLIRWVDVEFEVVE